MKLIDDVKKELTEADKNSNNSKNEYHEAARNIVNIQRQFFYGEESSSRRLSKVKQIILDAVKKGV